ncbi:MAG TPA: FAD-dependent oxidoreductase [Steroidobacteraceae bacterium]|nr:FAD-dependent oxidoreductase [Steroidobacteraceae bacterium]
MSLQRVYEPLRIRQVELPNRIVRTAHGTHFSHAEINDTFIAFHEARARGGCGLTILETASVHPSAPLTLLNFDDRFIPGYRRLMAAVRPHGMKVFQQLWHGGHLYPTATGGPPWGVSNIPGAAMGIVPVPMTEEQIREIISAFAAAATRCREGGLDGVELHAAHGYLFHQFLSPLYNTRTDRWGGSLENRMRFLKEALRAVRKAVGPDFVVGMRVSASQAPRGLSEAEVGKVIEAVEAEGLIDFLNASWGDYFRMDTMNSGMHDPAGYELPSSSQLTAVSKVPRIVAGRFRTLEEAEQVLREGVADLVSMVRAHIADPDLVRKTRAGRATEVRPCIGCNQGCIGGLMRNGRLGCLVNPAVGFETTLSETHIRTAAAARRVFVVGGGPAGLEAARIAALAGHRVILAEAASHLGGTINIAKRAPKLSGIGDILPWYESELQRLGVEVRLDTYVEAEDIRDEAPDALIVATGSRPRMDGMQIGDAGEPATGVELPHVLSSIDLLTRGPTNWGSRAIVLDDVGHYEAIAAAEFLIGKGVAVAYLTRHPNFAPYVESTGRAVPALERLYAGDFTLYTRHHLAAIRAGECDIRPIQGKKKTTVRADHVVLVTPNESLRELYDELRDFPHRVLIGDALAPRDMQQAIADGRKAAWNLTA